MRLDLKGWLVMGGGWWVAASGQASFDRAPQVASPSTILGLTRSAVRCPFQDRARGMFAKYGQAPSAEEIDANRAEMFRNFGEGQ